ncbi:hypothetical protein LBMAG21_06170 [Armatimonadota bacterium]|nr:hypothetical protein LBMAG21_06170 [Armatimonadota bacterium]
MFEKMKEVLQQRLAGTHEEEALRQPKRKFLLVESDKEFRNFVRDYVMDTPYDVVLVSSGLEALERVQADAFEFLMISATLPDMDGEELAGMLSANETTKRLPVVMIMEQPFPPQPKSRNIVACMERTLKHDILLAHITYCFGRVTEVWAKGTFA